MKARPRAGRKEWIMGGAFSLTHILIVVLVLVLLFGANRIPELMRSLGSGVKEFKSGMHQEAKEEPRPQEGSGQGTENPGS